MAEEDATTEYAVPPPGDEPHASAEETDRPAEQHCPNCGAPAERGQLVCLECGARIALTYRRPPSWKVPVAILVVVVALCALGAALAVTAIGDDAKKEVSAAPPHPRTPPSRPAKPKAARPAPAASALTRQGGLYAWPSTLTGFTVAINSTQDEGSARTFAQSAATTRPAKVGVIRGDDFRTLPKGFYVVFAGYYATREQADAATARLGKRFKGAFVQPVKR